MKKSTVRTAFFTLLAAASLLSYIYLNSTYTASGNAVPDGDPETELIEELKEPETEVVLPDVRLLKKVVETAERFLPAS